MTTSTITATLPTLTDEQRARLTERLSSGYSLTSNYWRSAYTYNDQPMPLSAGYASGYGLELALENGYIRTARAEDIWNEAHNEHAAREASQTVSPALPDWVPADAGITGPVSDSNLAKLRELIETSKRLERELAEALAPITDGSDERLHPVLKLAAEEANEREYCHVYDQISSAAGFPTRDELIELGVIERPTARYAVSTHITIETTVYVDATDEDDAVEQVDEMEYTDLMEEAGLSRFNHESHDARRADRA